MEEEVSRINVTLVIKLMAEPDKQSRASGSVPVLF